MEINFEKISIKKLAGLICERLKANNIDAVLVGGACVSIYTNNKYMSGDLDFITYSSMKELEPVLNELGFIRESSRHFINKECDYFIEFPAPPITIGREPINKFYHIKTAFGLIKLLSPTDSVRDRLSAYYFWNDRQSLEQALMIAKSHKIKYKKIKEWSKNENKEDKFNEFLEILKDYKNQSSNGKIK